MRVRFWTVSKLPDKCRQPRSIAVIMFTRVLLSNSDLLAAHVFGGHRIDPVYRNSIWIGACRYSRRVCCEAPALPSSEVLVCYGSFATELGGPCRVCFTPDSDRTTDIAGCPFRAEFVAKVGCYRDRLAISLRTTGFDQPALTLSTQLLRYAMHKAAAGGGRATSEASRRRF